MDLEHNLWIPDHNVAPVANAGGDFSVTLPVSAVVVDGSKSTDDVAVTRWLWQRDATSLAAGQVINSSDHSPVLMVSIDGGVIPADGCCEYMRMTLCKMATLSLGLFERNRQRIGVCRRGVYGQQ